MRESIRRRGPPKLQQQQRQRQQDRLTRNIIHATENNVVSLNAFADNSASDSEFLAYSPAPKPNCGDFQRQSGTLDVVVAVSNPALPNSPGMTVLSPLEPLLWDFYVNFFSRTYPTCSDASNPFLSCLIPIAFQCTPVRHALLAMAALQARHSYDGSIDQEIRRLRRSALAECRKISGRASGWQPLSSEQSAGADTHFGFPGAMLILSREEKLCLVTTAVLMILSGKLAGANYESFRPHMDFAREFFVFEETFGSDLEDMTQTPLYVFLRSLTAYNGLLASLAIGKAVSRESGAEQPCAMHIQLPSDQSRAPNQAFLTILSRISEGVERVSSFEFDQWDGNLDFIPSLALLPPDAFNDGPGADEDITIREIYRSAGRVYFFQQLRDRQSLPQTLTTLSFPPLIAQKQIEKLITQAIELCRLLGETTRYNTALLFPLGIIAPELRNTSDRAFVLSKLDLLQRTLHFEHFSGFSKDLIHAWARMDAGSQTLWQNWHPRQKTRLIG